MKSLSTLAAIGLLFFACKLCSFTGNTNRPIPYPSPTPRPMMYAADLLKSKLGSFTVVKRRTRDELLKDSEGFIATILKRSNDAGIAEYKSETSQSLLLWVFSFPSPEAAASTFEEFEKDIKGSYRWSGVRTTTTQRGKRIEGIDSKARGAVIWTNGYWLFMTSARGGLSEASSLADAVGY